MSTASHSPNRLQKFDIRDEEHPVWLRSFNDETRLQQIEDDLLAGTSVSAVLITIVTFGLLLGLFGVLIAI